MNKVLVYLLFFLLLNTSYAQEEKKSLESQSNSLVKNYYFKGLDFLSKNNFDEAFKSISSGLEASKKTNQKDLMAFGYLHLGGYFYQKKNYQIAIENLKKSLAIFIYLKNEKETYNCYFKLGRSYYRISEFDASLVNHFKALEIAERINNEKEIAENLGRIGEVYLLTPDLRKAQINFKKALKIYERLGDEQGIVGCFTNLGASYQKQGGPNKKELIIKAIDYFKQGLVRAKKANLQRNESIFLGNIGSSYRSLDKYDESLEFLFRALKIKVKLKNYGSAAHSCNDISETYSAMNNLVKAKEFALKAIEYSKGFNIHQERFGYYLLSKIEYKTGNFKSSHGHLKRYHQIHDSLFSLQKMAKINDLQIQYETEKKNLTIEAQESNIALLDSKNSIKNQWLLFGGLGLLSIFAFITLQKSKNTAKKEKLLQEKFSQDLLISQEEERTRIARELHDSVGQQLTLIKRKSQNIEQQEITKMTNKALEEVRSISRNLYPALLKQLGLKESIEQLINEYDEQTELFFSMDIDLIDEYFTENTSLNFYRLVQECLTNIVKHAKAKSVTVNIKKEDKSIITLISDNGKGFDVDKNKKKNSLGLKTIFERIKIMNGNLSINSKINNGTNFIFSIPIKNES